MGYRHKSNFKKLRFGVSHHAAKGIIHLHEPAIQFGHAHSKRCVFEDLAEALFAVLECLLDLLTLGNIVVLDDNSGEAMTQEYRDLRQEPSLFRRIIARIFLGVLRTFTIQNRPDTGGEGGGLPSLRAGYSIAYRQ